MVLTGRQFRGDVVLHHGEEVLFEAIPKFIYVGFVSMAIGESVVEVGGILPQFWYVCAFPKENVAPGVVFYVGQTSGF